MCGAKQLTFCSLPTKRGMDQGNLSQHARVLDEESGKLSDLGCFLGTSQVSILCFKKGTLPETRMPWILFTITNEKTHIPFCSHPRRLSESMTSGIDS